ncbi:MAG: asparagine--tRNA ligase [Candidatus Eiseniibacteriota bacterium]
MPEARTLNVVAISDLGRFVGQEVEVRGWVHQRRGSGKIAFLVVRDGTGVVQGVGVLGELADEMFERLDNLPQESAVVVTGVPRAEARAPGGYEIALTGITVVHRAEPYPISPKEHGTEFLMDHRHLWLRSPRQHAILRVRATLIAALRNYFDARGFVLVDAPIFTPNACEGTTTLFETQYFDQKAYLTQSGQLYMEAAAMAFGKVYSFGPTFRAEKSKTRRHLIEFWMLEPEMAWATLDDVMALEEDMLTEVVGRVLEERKAELAHLERDTKHLSQVKKPFHRLHYDAAVELLHSKGMPFEWGGDFGAPDETAIAESFDRPVFVHHFPTQIKAFYMERDPESPKHCLSVDCLAPEGYGEITGGGQRSANLAYLEQQIEAHGLPKKPFEWYLDLRRYGSVPHAGFGIGVERTLAWICGLEHVRETIPFPRLLNRLEP